MPLYTDAQLQQIPAFGDLSGDQIRQVAADAGSLYQQVQGQPGVEIADLRVWAEGLGVDAARFNRALLLLEQTGKLVDVSPGPLSPDSPAQQQGVAAQVADAFTLPELRKAATRARADVPKSATKVELAHAIVVGGAR